MDDEELGIRNELILADHELASPQCPKKSIGFLGDPNAALCHECGEWRVECGVADGERKWNLESGKWN